MSEVRSRLSCKIEVRIDIAMLRDGETQRGTTASPGHAQATSQLVTPPLSSRQGFVGTPRWCKALGEQLARLPDFGVGFESPHPSN